MNGWIGVDLDGTLAEYHGWKGITHIGRPVTLMVDRVDGWLADGIEVRIMTARVSVEDENERRVVIRHIENWCITHIGTKLPITNVKDFGMIELWDDRCVTVEENTGRVICSPHGQPTP